MDTQAQEKRGTGKQFSTMKQLLSRYCAASFACALAVTMSGISRALSLSKSTAVGTVLAAGLALAACSEKSQSLADYIAAICAAPFRNSPANEVPYLTENVSAMTKMMTDMGIRPSGDVDQDFVAMMVPHHQGAIDMAQAELRYGHNDRLKRMAQEIIVTQLEEITAMRLALGQPLPPSIASPDQVPSSAPIASSDTAALFANKQ